VGFPELPSWRHSASAHRQMRRTGCWASRRMSNAAPNRMQSRACPSVRLWGFSPMSRRRYWFGSLRGRIGWTNDPALYYLPGGWAYGQVTTDYAVQIGPPLDSHNFSQILSGWVIGGGLETQISHSISSAWVARAGLLAAALRFPRRTLAAVDLTGQ
jgi:opacity protein-like surface antigen